MYTLVVRERFRLNLCCSLIISWDGVTWKVYLFVFAKKVEMLDHPPYSPDLAPADYFLFPKIKAELAGDHIAPGGFKKAWYRVMGKVKKEDFTKAFWKWTDRHEKCIELEGGYVKKN